jgi:prophage regulatory protein
MSEGDRLLPFAEVSKMVGLKRTAIYAAVAAGAFPRPLKIGKLSRWSERELAAWIKDLKVVRSAA